MSLKDTIKSVAAYWGDQYFLPRFRRFCRTDTGKPLLIVDIDNTIADTVAYEKAHPGRRIDIHALEPILSVQQWLSEQAATHEVAFLSARNYRQYRGTIQWLHRHGFTVASPQNLFMVLKPAQKIRYLQYAAKCRKTVSYIDDLSYFDPGQQKVVIHDHLVQQIKTLPIRYYDLAFISSLSSPAV